MVLIGTGGDHPVNMQLAVEAGIAAALDQREAEAPLLLSTADRALGDPELRAAATALRAECDAMEPISEAVRTLEDVAHGPRSDN